MNKRSIYEGACKAAEAHASVSDGLSQQQALRGEWNRDRWWLWASRAVIEHVKGETYWVELGDSAFASVTAENPERGRLLERILAIETRLEDPELRDFAARQQNQREWATLMNRLLDA